MRPENGQGPQDVHRRVGGRGQEPGSARSLRPLLQGARQPRAHAGDSLGEEAVFTVFEYFSRPPHSDSIGPYHQDNGYFCYEPPQALAFWIPLDDVDEDNGGVVYAKGSHEAGLLPHEASGIHGSQRLVDSDEQLRDYPEIAGVLPRGGCTIHHCLTAHRSGPNTTNSRRRAIVADYKTAGAEESKSLRAKLERERDELLRRVAERANATEAADQ